MKRIYNMKKAYIEENAWKRQALPLTAEEKQLAIEESFYNKKECYRFSYQGTQYIVCEWMDPWKPKTRYLFKTVYDRSRPLFVCTFYDK